MNNVNVNVMPVNNVLGHRTCEAKMWVFPDACGVFRCLSFSPLGLERHVDSFFTFCSCLNNFFMHSKIPTPPLTHVTPGNMITSMADTKNRSVGHFYWSRSAVVGQCPKKLHDVMGPFTLSPLWCTHNKFFCQVTEQHLADK